MKKNGIVPGAGDFPWTQLNVDIPLLLKIAKIADIPGNQYRYGSKIRLVLTTAQAVGKFVDCSGWVRYCLYQTSGVEIPDGSAIQRDWFKDKGFKLSTTDAAKLTDGVLRVAFLPPVYNDGEMVRAGHVALVIDGETIESHSGTGPDRRPWTANGWQSDCIVYVVRRSQL